MGKAGQGLGAARARGDLGMDKQSCPTFGVTCTTSSLHMTRWLSVSSFPPIIFCFVRCM